MQNIKLLIINIMINRIKQKKNGHRLYYTVQQVILYN